MKVKAPIGFQGQKNGFRDAFINYLSYSYSNQYTFIDLFGGTGLLSHYTHSRFPKAHVVYNDHDNYSIRVQNLDKTNLIIDWLDNYMKEHNVPLHTKLTKEQQEEVMKYIKDLIDNNNYVDLQTLSKDILWSNKPVKDYEELNHRLLYNNISKKRRDSNQFSFYDGIEIVHKDYKELYEEYKGREDVVFIIDPPYLFSPSVEYQSNFKMPEYLNTLDIFIREKNVIYFTNGDLVDIIKWLSDKIPEFQKIKTTEVERRTSKFNGGYVDCMLVKEAEEK